MPGHGRSPVLLVNIMNPISISGQYLGRIVLRAIIYNDDFCRLLRLLQDTIYCPPHQVAPVIGRNNNTDG